MINNCLWQYENYIALSCEDPYPNQSSLVISTPIIMELHSLKHSGRKKWGINDALHSTIYIV